MAVQPVPVSCDLCGLSARRPILASLGGTSRAFCCSGCRQVYQILLESHALDNGQDPTQTTLYQQCLQMGLIARPQEGLPGGNNVGAGLAVLSDPVLSDPAPGGSAEMGQAEHGAMGQGGASPAPTRRADALQATREAAFQIGGMWCSACAWLIEHALMQQKGVMGCRVYFASDVVKVTYRPARTAPEEVMEAIRRLGYTAQAFTEGGSPQDTPAARARRAGFVRAVVAIIFAMNVGMFSIALYVGYVGRAYPQFQLDAGAARILSLWALALTLPVLWAGMPLFARAWQAARQKTATMETLISLGAGAAFLYSVWAVLRGSPLVYFDTAAMLIALVLVGKHLEAGAKGEATGAIALLHGLLPKKAQLLLPDGTERLVAVAQLAPGDFVRVRPGERIPADGIVKEGAALVDESLLTGEARPAAKAPGDAVTGATIATDAPLTVEVTRVGADSTLAQMIALVEDALASKSPTERWADRIARVFVPAIVLLALVTGGVLLLGHVAPAAILIRMVAVLVIACPCALGLATPMAISTGVGAAAERGILIANTDVLETLPRVRHLLLDKTGTLTEGRFAVQKVVTSDTARDADLAALAALEALSEHPLGRALVSYAQAQGATVCPAVAEFARVEGQGVVGKVDGNAWFAGNRALAQAQGAIIPDASEQAARDAEAAGLTAVFYGTGNTMRGCVTLGDALRPHAADAVARLRALGLTLEVVSGDAEVTVQTIARAARINDATACMTPADKVARVKGAQETGASRSVVALAGDGINDAPALAQADVGIAFGAGTEIARRAADITLIGDDLGRLADLFTLARRTARVMKQNLFWACLYNGVCIPLAVAGYVSPIVAAGAMVVSSLSVVFNTRRLRRQLEQA